MSLSFETVSKIAAKGEHNLIPIVKEVVADLETPVSAFLKIHRGDNSFLLESVEGGERQARYSFIGTEPYKVIRESSSDPLVAVEEELAQYTPYPHPGLPNFNGGGIGYISYDCVKYFEPKVNIPDKNALGIPESIFMFCKSLVVFDHVKHSLQLVAHIHVTKDGDLKKEYNEALQRLESLAKRLDAEVPVLNPHAATLQAKDMPAAAEPPMTSNHGQDGYCGFVRSLKADIVKGNIIQAVPSHRLSRPLRNVHAFDVYRQLRVINPSPYMFYLDLGDFKIAGASPECLLKVEAGRVYTHPIAGTRKRGETPEEDAALAKELLADEKERAEHIMLVDLGRNDVGRVSKPGTVKVDSLMHIEKYSHVMHIVSNVSGELKDGMSVFDATRSIFPAGTVSGAPKIRAMQLVAELEKERRGVYAGAVGYVGFDRKLLDVAIAIRTLVIKDGVAYLQAGGGIVHDSEEMPEYKETVKKMRACAVAISRAEAQRSRSFTRPSTPKPNPASTNESEAKRRKQDA